MSQLNPNAGLYVSVNDLSDIDSAYWHLVTGIEMLKNELLEIPANILNQNQLTYLDISSKYRKKNNFQNLPKALFELTNLQHLNLMYCNIENLPLEIDKLRDLTNLDLRQNQLSSLPHEIGNLSKLTYLGLNNNKLKCLSAIIQIVISDFL